MSTIAERGDERAKRRVHDIVARRLLLLMQKAGIPDDMLDVSEQDISSLLYGKWEKCGAGAEAVIAYIANKHKVWARRGTYIVIEGGGPFDEANRDKVMRYCLLKAIIANFNDVVVEAEEITSLGEVTRTFSGEMTKIVDFLSNLPVLAAWEKNRFALLNEWARIPILAITEIDPERGPRQNSDAASIMDSILRQRRIAKKPTILTFMGPASGVAEGVSRGNTSHGVELANIVRTSHNESNGMIRILLNGENDVQKKK